VLSLSSPDDDDDDDDEDNDDGEEDVVVVVSCEKILMISPNRLYTGLLDRSDSLTKNNLASSRMCSQSSLRLLAT